MQIGDINVACFRGLGLTRIGCIRPNTSSLPSIRELKSVELSRLNDTSFLDADAAAKPLFDWNGEASLISMNFPRLGDRSLRSWIAIMTGSRPSARPMPRHLLATGRRLRPKPAIVEDEAIIGWRRQRCWKTLDIPSWKPAMPTCSSNIGEQERHSSGFHRYQNAGIVGRTEAGPRHTAPMAPNSSSCYVWAQRPYRRRISQIRALPAQALRSKGRFEGICRSFQSKSQSVPL
jgi:hypothetical protein